MKYLKAIALAATCFSLAGCELYTQDQNFIKVDGVGTFEVIVGEANPSKGYPKKHIFAAMRKFGSRPIDPRVLKVANEFVTLRGCKIDMESIEWMTIGVQSGKLLFAEIDCP
tara:strand:+ start:119 stop:454 length:336 start_codon:yes stop_codon:yes gene_type:complete